MNAFEVDEWVEAYESALIAGEAGLANIHDYLPKADAATRNEILVELIRVTLEHTWRPGTTDALSGLQSDFPELFSSLLLLKPLAYEEYRLRATEGQSVHPRDYAALYDLDTSDWPIFSATKDSVKQDRFADDDWAEFSQSLPASATRLVVSRKQLPVVGEHFGPFKLIAVLGTGAFGKVFLARQTNLANRLIALKVIPGIPAEADKLARLQHTNIVPVYSVHRRGKLSGICMPFLGCVTLADLISSSSSQPNLTPSGAVLQSTVAARHAALSTLLPSSATTSLEVVESPAGTVAPSAVTRWGSVSLTEIFVVLGSRIAAGLAHAHAHGIEHRDIKPANILISNDGEPLILDFNLADDRSEVAGHAARLGGTLPYMSPEQLQQFQDQGTVDGRSDLFSLGVILYECLTAQHPFPIRRGSLNEVIRGMIEDRVSSSPIRPSQLNSAISPGLEAIILKCLVPNPADRYASAQDLHEDLEQHLHHRPLKHIREVSFTEQAVKWIKRNPKLWSATSVMIVSALVIAGLIAGWLRRDRVIASKVARESLQEFATQTPEVRSLLAINSPGTDLEGRGISTAITLLRKYQVLDNPQWYEQPNVRMLSTNEKQQLAVEVVELLALLSRHTTSRIEPKTLRTSAESGWQALTSTKLPTALLAQSHDDHSSAINAPTQDSTAAIQLLLSTTDRLRRGQLAEARRTVEELVKLHPQDEAAWLLLAHCFAEERDFVSAESAATASIALNQNSYLAWHMRGLLRYEAKRFQPANDDFTQAMRCRPNDSIALFNRGLTFQALKRHDAAIEDFTQAIDLGLTETRVYFARARSWVASKQPAQAAADRNEGIARTPRDCLSWVERGLAQLETDPKLAAADLQQAVRLNPTSHFALINLAHVLGEHLKQTAEAIAPLTSLLRVVPTDRIARGSRAVLFARLGKSAEAIADVQALLPEKGDAFACYQVGCVFALLSKDNPSFRQQSLAQLQRALLLDPRLLESMRNDHDLANLHDLPQWSQLIGLPTRPVVSSDVTEEK